MTYNTYFNDFKGDRGPQNKACQKLTNPPD